ncbi:MAG: EAL domain-containing protein [Candidatus Thiodiazotropha taylori]|nr:EAL domain-containing protein [Candidatus Thiodiazotropha taylori]MCG7936762.1 EAL domain-containing protein [Candidatus Thiodiazotropha taylori]MCG7971515.1 EAL domain-containing protein [Candidatus Thiodiazotropha taylori]
MTMHYKSLFENQPSAAVVIDKFSVIKLANKKASDLFGFRTAEMMEGHFLLRLFGVNEMVRLKETLSNLRKKSNVCVEDVSYKDEAAVVHHLDLHLSATYDPNLAYDLVLVTIQVHKSDMEDGVNKNSLLAILNNLDASVVTYNRDGVCTFANDDFLKVNNKKYEEVVGRRRESWMPYDVAVKEEAKSAKVLITGLSSCDEVELSTSLHHDSRYVISRFPIIGKANSFPSGTGELITDVTRQRVQEEQLTLVLNAFRLSRDAILMTNEQNKIISVNDAFERITGYVESEVLGKDPRLLASNRHDHHFYKRMWQSINQNNHWEGEIWNRRKSGEIYPEWLSISKIVDEIKSNTHYIAVFTDITQKKKTEDEIENLAFYDVLTGLANRYLLADRVEKAIHSDLRSGATSSLVYFDLDHFKTVNDTMGHSVGDKLLQEVAMRMKRLIREKDTLSRLGGDEFVLFMPDINPNDIEARLHALVSQLNQPYTILDTEVTISASFGVAVSPDDGSSYENLLRHADMAMYKAKEDGRNSVCFFNRKLEMKAIKKIKIDNELRYAIDAQELRLNFQPQLLLTDNRIVGCESLLRWKSRVLGEVSPMEFIPVAEKSGLINSLGKWVLQQAVSKAKELLQIDPELKMAVNISASQLRSDDFLSSLLEICGEQGVPANSIELEVTESMLMEKAESTMKLLKSLANHGFHMAIDDFGTGYSSLAYLNWMPVSVIKIDREFVRDIHQNEKHRKVCVSIIRLASSLDIKTVAEGVESGEQLRILQQEGCDMIQGYHYSRPLSGSDMVKFCRESSDFGSAEGEMTRKAANLSES